VFSLSFPKKHELRWPSNASIWHLNEYWKQQNVGPYPCYIQRVLALSSSASEKQKQEIASLSPPWTLIPTIWNHGSNNINHELQLLIWLLRILFPFHLRYQQTIFLTLMWFCRPKQLICWFQLTTTRSPRFEIMSSAFKDNGSSPFWFDCWDFISWLPGDDLLYPRSLCHPTHFSPKA